MTRDVTPNLKPDGYGPCQCGHDRCRKDGELREGRLRKPHAKTLRRHVYDCKCPSCTSKRSNGKGNREGARARKALKIPGANTRHEELWGGSLRVEVKAGKQIAPAVTAYERCRTQSEQSRSFGDHRPFAAVWMPDGSSDGVLACRLSDAFEVAAAILENQAAAS